MGIEVSKYANLGVSFDGQSSPMKGIESAIFRLSEDVASEFREYFKENNLNATSALSNSIGGLPVRITDKGAEIDIVAEDYFKFIDEGVNGVEQSRQSPFSFKSLSVGSSMVNSLKNSWIGGRQVPLFPKFKTFEQQAYAIAVNIKKKGIEAKNILDGIEQKNNLEQKIADSIEASLGYAVELTFTKIVRDVNN